MLVVFGDFIFSEKKQLFFQLLEKLKTHFVAEFWVFWPEKRTPEAIWGATKKNVEQYAYAGIFWAKADLGKCQETGTRGPVSRRPPIAPPDLLATCVDTYFA